MGVRRLTARAEVSGGSSGVEVSRGGRLSGLGAVRWTRSRVGNPARTLCSIPTAPGREEGGAID